MAWMLISVKSCTLFYSYMYVWIKYTCIYNRFHIIISHYIYMYIPIMDDIYIYRYMYIHTYHACVHICTFTYIYRNTLSRTMELEYEHLVGEQSVDPLGFSILLVHMCFQNTRQHIVLLRCASTKH